MNVQRKESRFCTALEVGKDASKFTVRQCVKGTRKPLCGHAYTRGKREGVGNAAFDIRGFLLYNLCDFSHNTNGHD